MADSCPTFTRSVRTFVVCTILALLPAAVHAQSAISGLVTDATGASLPGVTVEAASPALIEKVRTVVTDGQGRYMIVDLRPGTYIVTFTLTGFNTLRREAIDLPSNFTLALNAEMRLGALEEAITVTAAASIVDVQSTQRMHVLNRDLLDALPTARNYSGLAALMPGVRMSNTDVGGNQQMEQIYMTVHGSRRTDTTVQVDGMSLNSLMNDGQVQAYYSDAANAEVTYQTSGAGADVSGGGVRINMIPHQGGNTFSGSLFVGGTNGAWQSDNVTQTLRDRGLLAGDRVDMISDVNMGLGGPIQRDRLWFFASWRRIATNEVVANNFFKDGSPGIEDQWIQNQMVRLTWQANAQNKLTVYHDRYPKFKGHEMGPLTDPETAARRRNNDNALYYTAQAKWTSTMSSRLLVEGGFSTNVEYYTARYQPGIQKDRGTPEWFTQIGKTDLTTLENWDGITSPTSGIDPKKWNLSGVVSYVTGTHVFKSGVQWGFGTYQTERDINGDLVQRYRNGRPDSVRVYNTPLVAKEFLNADLGVFAQDSWTIRRLTLNGGVRLEYFNGEIEAQHSSGGRFVPERRLSAVHDMPNWFDVAPRFGIAYDLFGNARTALKASINKYMAGQTLGFAQRYNPMQLQQDDRTWTDLNNDNVAQDNEIGRANNLRFGEPTSTLRPDANLRREFDMEYSAAIQHELLRGVSVSGAWYRRGTYNQRRTDNTLFDINDYMIVNVVSPLDGSIIPAYNLNSTKQGLLDRVDSNSTDSELRRQTYNGYEIGVSARIPRAHVFGGWTIDRNVDVHCDTLQDPGSSTFQPRTDFHFCDQSRLGLPFRHEVKLAGSYTLPRGVQVNVAYQSYAGAPLIIQWNIARATRYAADCLAPCTPGALVIPSLTPASIVLDLIPQGQQYYGRLNQVDIGFRKIFAIGTIRVSGQVDIFNATNSSYIKSQNRTYGSSLGQPLEILQPRMIRLATQLRF